MKHSDWLLSTATYDFKFGILFGIFVSAIGAGLIMIASTI